MRSRTRASSPFPASPMSKPTMPSVERRLRRSAVSSSTIKILPCYVSILSFFADLWQSEEEGRLRLRCAVDPDAAAVCLGNSPGHGETDARPRGFVVRTSRAIEAIEDAQPLFRDNVRPFILDAENHFGIRRIDGKRDYRSGASIFRRVIDHL